MEKEFQAVLPWFRVHIVILNDPGRLISVHIMHSALLSGGMLFYEVIIVDPTEPVYSPTWRQGLLYPFILVKNRCYTFNVSLVIRYKA